jgi:protein-disulfide isomerase
MDSTEAPAERMPQLLQARYNSFAESRKHNLNTIGWPVIGDPNSPMTVVMYFSSTCPACKTNFREILPMVTDGHLKGKAKIVVKPFGNNFGNRAIVAAYDMGRFTDFMLALAQAGVRVDEELIYDIADGMLFDRDVFRQRVESDDVAGRVEESSTEASGTGATHVPTYFIEGRRYDSVLFARWVADAIEFVHDAEFKK